MCEIGDIWDQHGEDKKMRAEKLCRTPVEFYYMDKRRPKIDPKTTLKLAGFGVILNLWPNVDSKSGDIVPTLTDT